MGLEGEGQNEKFVSPSSVRDRHIWSWRRAGWSWRWGVWRDAQDHRTQVAKYPRCSVDQLDSRTHRGARTTVTILNPTRFSIALLAHYMSKEGLRSSAKSRAFPLPGLLPDPTGDAAGAPLRPRAPTSSAARFYFDPDITDPLDMRG